MAVLETGPAGEGGSGCSWGWRPPECFVFSHVPVVVRLLFVRVFIFGFAADHDSDDLWFPAFMQHAMQGPSCVCVQNVLVS